MSKDSKAKKPTARKKPQVPEKTQAHQDLFFISTVTEVQVIWSVWAHSDAEARRKIRQGLHDGKEVMAPEPRGIKRITSSHRLLLPEEEAALLNGTSK
jgi:hypothetical protein